MEVFIVNKSKNIDAHGFFDMKTKVLTVAKGSTVSETISSSPSFRGASTIRKNRELYVVDGVVKEDVSFKSSSTAANFVTGNSSNGLIVWKTADGKQLKDII